MTKAIWKQNWIHRLPIAWASNKSVHKCAVTQDNEISIIYLFFLKEPQPSDWTLNKLFLVGSNRRLSNEPNRCECLRIASFLEKTHTTLPEFNLSSFTCARAPVNRIFVPHRLHHSHANGLQCTCVSYYCEKSWKGSQCETKHKFILPDFNRV